MDAHELVRGKKVTLMGLGLLGRGVGDARFLAQAGAEVIVTDMKSAEALAPSLEALEGLPITYRLGGHELIDFEGRDLVLVAPKTPLDSPYVAHAKAQGAHVTMSGAFAARFAHAQGVRVVGVTGTRGKTTTTQMIAHILKHAGVRTHVGGNIQGVSTLALLPQIEPGDTLVLELDSWQLQGFAAERFSPDVAVFTNLMPDHQDYYGGMEAYFKDKAQIFLHQDHDDVLVRGVGVGELLDTYGLTPASRVIDGTAQPVPALRIPGEHNRMNAAYAYTATRALGIDEKLITEALATFTGVAGRLQHLRDVGGVSFYNDTTATTPEATLAALKALQGRPIVLILGGSDKGLDMSSLISALPTHTKNVVLLAGTGTERIREHLPEANVHDTLAGAFAEAVAYAQEGDQVLLSPAFASFGMFTNEYDRGDQYATLVESL